MNLNWTWNGEKIHINRWFYGGNMVGQMVAVLDGFDPTDWDADTTASGPHATTGYGDSPQQAACDLIEQIWEMG